MAQTNVTYLNAAAAQERDNQLEAVFCDMQSIITCMGAVIDGERHTPAREWLLRQLQAHHMALEEMVSPHA